MDGKQAQDDQWKEGLPRIVADSFPLALYIVDERSDVVLYANRRFREMWGLEQIEGRLPREGLRNGQVIEQSLPLLKDAPGFLKSLRSLSPDNRAVIEDEVPLLDGRIIRRVSASIRDTADIYLGRLYIYEDISRSKCSEIAHQHSCARYEDLVQSLEGMVWEADPDTFRITFMSRQSERILGYAAEQWAATPTFWEDHIHPEDRERTVASCLRAVQEKRPNDLEYRMIGADGRIVWVRDLVTVEVQGERVSKLRGIMIDVTARKQVERELVDSQAFILSVIDNIPDMVFVKDARELRFLRLNRAGERLLGYGQEELAGKSDYDIFPWEEAEARTARDLAILRSGQLADIVEERVLTKQHGERILRTKKLPIINGAGEPQYLLGISEDITEYRRAREALQESEDRFKSFMEHTPALAWLKDEHGRYVYANRMWQEQVGLPSDEWRHLTDDAIHPPDVARQCRDGDLAVLTSGTPYEGLEISFDATENPGYWWVMKFPFQDRQGIRYVGGIALDVTERSRAEQSLQDSEQRYHALYEDNPTMYFTLAIDGTVLSVNRCGAGQLGYVPHELMGRSVLQVFHREDHAQVLEQLADCLTNVAKTMTWELRKVRKDGTTLWVRECARAVPDPKGNLVVLVVCEDITERRLAEKALRRAQVRMQAIQAERERLAHDLHDNIIQQLYAIGMGLEEGRYRLKEGGGRFSVPALLKRTIEEVNLVIEDVRDFIGGKDPLHLLSSATIAAQFRKLERKSIRGPAIVVRMDEGVIDHVPSLQAKHLYLIAREAVSNILRHSQATKGSVSLRAENETFVMTIQDDGIGFDPADGTVRRSGLKTMRARAKKIGARFRLRSRREKGTVIVVEAPKGAKGA